MTYSTILFTIEDGLARLTLNRPDRLNAINNAMHVELADALETMSSTPGVRALLLTGAGRAFCAGQDLGDRRREPGDPPHDLGESVEQRYNPFIRRLMALPVPKLAAVNGVAAGAGANIAIACDIVIATESARFIQAFTKIGLSPDCGGTWHLPRLVGQARALGLALTAEPIDARTAADWGLIWRAVPDEAFAAEVETLARRLADGPTRALVAASRAIRRAGQLDLDAQLDHEGETQRMLGFTTDYAEGVAAFAAKRPPAFTGA